MPHPGFIEYEATASYSDGTIARRRFFWWPEASDYELKVRATQIWSLAQHVGAQSEKLTVTRVAVQLEVAA